MKTLYLLRHAKSSWSFDELSDQERPLNDRGRTDAPRMGQALCKREIALDLLVSSPAVRALSTAVLVAREIGYPHEKIVVEPGIYEARVEDILSIIHQLPDSSQSVMLVGHNPTFTDVVNTLASAGTTPLLEMPTAAVACLRFECGRWEEVSRENAEFYFYDFPKDGK